MSLGGTRERVSVRLVLVPLAHVWRVARVRGRREAEVKPRYRERDRGRRARVTQGQEPSDI